MAIGLISTTARAADKPVIGPPAAWVKPSALPPIPAKNDQAAARLLLSDQQISLEPGRMTVYFEGAVQIETAQGLTAGNLSVPWRPDTDVLTVHRLAIRRGDTVIDVLGSGQTFTVLRRETNLDAAVLDGVLTASIQPEGLQVGDVLDFAFSITSSDPTLKSHVEQVAAAWNSAPVVHAHLAMRWPSTVPLRLRATPALPTMTPVKNGDARSVELSLDDIQPLVAPRGAPIRYQVGRLLEASDFASWSDLGALMAPLYDHAATIPDQGPLRTELDRIRAASPDAKTRAQAALALVQDRIRYVALAMGAGGLVPADAAVTWDRRYGDCKGKTALLLALLHSLGIQAEPVAVSTTIGDGMDERLPMIGLFDHVLVRAIIGGRSYWLDGTRIGDTSLDRIVVPDFKWGLPLVAHGAALVRMMPPPLDRPGDETAIRIDASGGLTTPAPTVIDETFRGDGAIALNAAIGNLTGDARDRALRDYWRNQFNFIDIDGATAAFDPASGEMHMAMHGTAHMDWSTGWYETDGTAIGYTADFKRDPGPGADAPYAVAYPYFTETTETILLPPGFNRHPPETKADVDQTIAGIQYHRTASFANGAFVVKKTERAVAPEFPAKDAAAAQEALRALSDQAVYIREPDDYQQTPAEAALALSQTPTTAAGFVTRGNLLLDRGEFDKAIADFDRANALDAKNAVALADRGIAHVWKEEYDLAQKDLAAADALDPRNAVVFRARGLMAQNQGAYPQAVAAYGKSLEIEPANAFALSHRAQAYRAMGNDDGAVGDARTVIASHPDMIDTYLLLANIYRGQGKTDQALAEAAAVGAANPQNAYAQVVAANVYSSLRKPDEAARAYGRALAIKPEAYIYLNRATNRPKGDVAGRHADIDAAAKLDPKSVPTLFAKADLQLEERDFTGAIATYSTAIALAPDDSYGLVQRGIAFTRAGKPALADADFSAARAKAKDAAALNNMCWSKATHDVALASALADCDAGLAKTPDNAAILDSRAFVLLRLGRWDESIADYTRALAVRPNQPSSLYGRGIARQHKGDLANARIDIDAAVKAGPYIAQTFDGFGVVSVSDAQAKTPAAR